MRNAARRLKRDKVVQTARLGSCKNFVSEREDLVRKPSFPVILTKGES